MSITSAWLLACPKSAWACDPRLGSWLPCCVVPLVCGSMLCCSVPLVLAALKGWLVGAPAHGYRTQSLSRQAKLLHGLIGPACSRATHIPIWGHKFAHVEALVSQHLRDKAESFGTDASASTSGNSP